MLTQEYLFSVLNYSEETGIFTWKYRGNLSKSWNSRCAFKNAGCLDRGYLIISLNGSTHRCHRLAWVYMTGKFPKGQIDHINGIGTDNRFINLRDVTPSENQRNRRCPQKTNKTGFLGVSKSRGKYLASIRIDAKNINLGRYETPEEAHGAYLLAKRKHHLTCTI